jgi:hypothetical protein
MSYENRLQGIPEEGESLREFTISTTQLENLAPLYTYQLTYTLKNRRKSFVEATRINENFSLAYFKLYEAEAEAVQSESGGLHHQTRKRSFLWYGQTGLSEERDGIRIAVLFLLILSLK